MRRPSRFSRKLRALDRRRREVRLFARAMESAFHPILAQIIPTRRCNLACSYCNEYDSFSQPVPLEEMLRRIDRLGELGTTIITLSGGEPLLHPQCEDMIHRIRAVGAMATVITNGYLLTPEKIGALNTAGLDYLQISIDNVQPDDTSKKSLKVLDRKLEWLAEYSEFAVTINTVLGAEVRHPQDALTIALRARSLGFNSTVGFLHDGTGQTKPLPAEQVETYRQIRRLETSVFSFSHFDRFQTKLAQGLPNEWHCRAGSRFLYVCEDGLVHYCSQQRGYPATPLAAYTQEDLEREFDTEKACAPHCSISCVHQVAMLDEVRAHPREMLVELIARKRETNPLFELPVPLRAVEWAFLANPKRAALLQRAAAALLRR